MGAMQQLQIAIEEVNKHLPGKHDQKTHGQEMFHGTTAQAAQRILKVGLLVAKTRKERTPGKKGVYATDKIDSAIEYGKMRASQVGKSEYGIIVLRGKPAEFNAEWGFGRFSKNVPPDRIMRIEIRQADTDEIIRVLKADTAGDCYVAFIEDNGDILYAEGPETKHFPGQHDQKTHGRKGVDEENLEYVYHGTLIKNLDDIRENGLSPNEYGNPLNFHGIERSAEFYMGSSGVIFRVAKKNLPKDTIYDSMTSASRTNSKVLPQYLEIRTGGKWVSIVNKHLPGQHDQSSHGGHDLTGLRQEELDALRGEHLVAALEAQTAMSAANVRLAAARQKIGNVTGPLSFKTAKQELEEAEAGLKAVEDYYKQMRRELVDIPIYVKHLPGKHSQKEHGRKGLGTADKNIKVRVIDREIIDQHLASIFRGRSVPSTDALAKVYMGGLDRLPIGTQVKIVISDSVVEEGAISIRGILVYKGERIGRFDRTISRHGTNVQAYHDVLYMNKDYQGTGFGSEFFYHSEDAYRLMGIDEIRTFANTSVGGYAWAKMGFEFLHKESIESTANLIAGKIQDLYDVYVEKNKLAGTESKWRDDHLAFEDKKKRMSDFLSVRVRKKLRAMKYPYQFAAVEVKMPDGEIHRVGKQVMIGHAWSAVKHLSRAASPAVRAGNKYRLRRRKALLWRKKVIS